MKTVSNPGSSTADIPGGARTIRVLVVDDHEVVREGLCTLLSEEPDITVVGMASSGAEGIKKANQLKPDILLMDIKMPDMDGFTATRQITRRQPDARVIMLTGYESVLYVSEAVQIGVKGFVSKDCPRRLISNTIRVVMDGSTVWDGDLIQNTVRSTLNMQKIGVGSHHRLAKQLTQRELEILRLLTKGLTNKDIAAKLSLSIETIKKSLKSIMGKLGASNRIRAAIIASRDGIV